jgi:hypothetical protein
MLPIKGTIFTEFQFFLSIPPVFLGGIIPPFTLTALERHQLHDLFLTRHVYLLSETPLTCISGLLQEFIARCA